MHNDWKSSSISSTISIAANRMAKSAEKVYETLKDQT